MISPLAIAVNLGTSMRRLPASSSALELTRFGTCPIVRNRGVCHGQVKGNQVEVCEAVPEGVSAPDGRVVSCGQYSDGVVAPIRPHALGDQPVGQAGRS